MSTGVRRFQSDLSVHGTVNALKLGASMTQRPQIPVDITGATPLILAAAEIIPLIGADARVSGGTGPEGITVPSAVDVATALRNAGISYDVGTSYTITFTIASGSACSLNQADLNNSVTEIGAPFYAAGGNQSVSAAGLVKSTWTFTGVTQGAETQNVFTIESL